MLEILFNTWADAENSNAQNLNAREIAHRLDPTRFRSTLFHRDAPDPRLVDRPNIRLIQLPRRLATPVVLRHMLWGRYDFMVYPRMDRADRLFRVLRPRGRKSMKLVAPIESRVDTLEGPGRPAWAADYYRYLADRADLVVPITPFIAQTLTDRFGRQPTTIIPVGVDIARIRRAMERGSAEGVWYDGPEAEGGGARGRVLFVGSLTQRKRPDLVLDAAEAFPRVQFRLLGHGPLRMDLEQRIDDRGLTNVEILSGRSWPECMAVLVASHILLLPSRVEGQPKVTLEAAAAGIPSLVFDDYQTTSVVDGVTGYQVRTFDQMLERLESLVDDSALRQRLGAAAREHVEQFDWDTVVPQWERLLAGPHSRA